MNSNDKDLQKRLASKAKELRATGHRLSTRRDFLAHGFTGFAAWTALPGLLGLGARSAMAAECGGGGAASTGIPLLVFDMAGGAALPGSFLVGKRGGAEDMLSSYNVLGWDPRASGALDTQFGIPMAARASTLLARLIAATSPEARARLKMGTFCHFAQDDTTSNRLNMASLALAAGTRGQYISNGLGQTRNSSGGNSQALLDDVALKPAFVSSLQDVIAAASFGGTGYAGLSAAQLKRMAQASHQLGTYQSQSVVDLPGGQVLAELAPCAYERGVQFADGVAGLDPRLDPIVQQVYNINQNSGVSEPAAVAAALAMNTLKGLAGPSTFTIGDCDYHTGSQTQGDERDGTMGDLIGRAVELAHRLQKPLFFQLITDGGCNSDPGTRNWRGDAGDKCVSVIGYYKPEGAPAQRRTQVGSFTDGQSADRDTLIGSQPSLAVYAAFANYLAVSGKLEMFRDMVPGVFTGAGQLQDVLIFEEA